MPECWPAYLFPCILSPFHTHSSADLPDEYTSPISSIEHFGILIVTKCWPADLPTYSPAYFPHFLLIQVQTCQMNTCPSSSIVHFCILQVLTCWPADLPTTSTCVAHNCPYSAKLFFVVLTFIGVLMWLTQIQDGGFGGGLCCPSIWHIHITWNISGDFFLFHYLLACFSGL